MPLLFFSLGECPPAEGAASPKIPRKAPRPVFRSPDGRWRGSLWKADPERNPVPARLRREPHHRRLDRDTLDRPAFLQLQAEPSDRIVKQDINQQLIPGLAESWHLVDDKTWEFKLRKGVVWHDGTPFTAGDILFTAERSEEGIPGSPTTPTRFFLLGDKKYKKIDDYTFHVLTLEPYAPMAADLSLPVVVGCKNGTGMLPKDYDAGKATVGTGPYQFVLAHAIHKVK
jgi:ABC-type transport system substrate-binding protein